MSKQQEQKNISITIAKLSSLAVAMFIFAVWVMPPIYTLFCELTGINGKTRGQYEAVSAEVDTSRLIKVQFVAVHNESMPWGFKPKEFSVMVHPGEVAVTHFVAHNPTDDIMVGQAVPSMVPNNATDYFHKTECFCFNKQVLSPDEQAELGLQFIVDQDIPKSVNTITLSYSLFDVTDMSAEDVAERAKQLESAYVPDHTTQSLMLTAENN